MLRPPGPHDTTPEFRDSPPQFQFRPLQLFFGEFVKPLLVGLLPLFFIVVLPERMTNNFDWATAIACGLSALAWAVAARFVFIKGLGRYRSGSSWSSGG